MINKFLSIVFLVGLISYNSLATNPYNPPVLSRSVMVDTNGVLSGPSTNFFTKNTNGWLPIIQSLLPPTTSALPFKISSAPNNGVTDATAQLQADILSLTNGGILWLNPGVYKVTSTLNCFTGSTNGIQIEGCGRSTCLWAVGDYGDILNFKETNILGDYGLSGSAVKNIYIDSATVRTTGWAIDTDWTDGFLADNIWLGRMQSANTSLVTLYNGINLPAEQMCSLINVHSETYSTAVYVAGNRHDSTGAPLNGFDGWISHCEFWGAKALSGQSASSDPGIYIANDAGGINVDNCNVSFFSDGIDIANSSHETFLHTDFFDTNWRYGVHVIGCGNFQWDGVWAAGNGSDGVHIDPGAIAARMDMGGMGTIGANGGYGLYVGAGQQRSLLSGAIGFGGNGGSYDIYCEDSSLTIGPDVQASIHGGTVIGSSGGSSISLQNGTNTTVRVAGGNTYIDVSSFLGNLYMTNSSGNVFLVKLNSTGSSASYTNIIFSSVVVNTLLTGLEAYYRMDETSGTRVDQLGNYNLLDSGSLVGYSAGKINNAADFTASEGSSALMSATGTAWAQPDTTVSCWINTSHDFSGYLGVIFQSGLDLMTIYINGDSTITVAVDFSGGWSSAQSTTSYNDGSWHNIVGIRSGGAVTLYVDGVQKATATGSGTPSNPGWSANIQIGEGGGNQNFFGLIDEYGVWNRALTSSEISALYNSGTPPDYSTFGTLP